MNTFGLALVVGSLLVAAGSFIWMSLKVSQLNGHSGAQAPAPGQNDEYTARAATEVEHIFSDDFREELRNRGRLHFEKIIGENAMFLQQDLRQTTTQLNEFIKQEVTKALQEEFSKYEESIEDAKKVALDSLQKTELALEEERNILRTKLEQEVTQERDRLIERFSGNMAEIVNHYVLDAIGNEIDLNDQLGYILSELTANKDVLVEDIRSGA